MTKEEFKENVYKLFLNIDNIKPDDDLISINYYLNNRKHLDINLNVYGDYRCFVILSDGKYDYKSVMFESYEQSFDELIIFKELILPKYL